MNERGNITLVGLCSLFLLSSLLLFSLLKEQRSLERVDKRKKLLLCIMQLREQQEQYVKKMFWFNKSIQASYLATLVPQTREAATLALNGLKLAQQAYHWQVIIKASGSKNCPKTTKMQLFFNLPYAHQGQLKRGFDQQATIRAKSWRVLFPATAGSGMIVANYLAKFNPLPSLKVNEREYLRRRQ